MIKGCVPLIRKTIVWRHRSTDTAAISFECDKDKLLKFRILGKSNYDGSGEVISFPANVGENGKYSLSMRVHGRNCVEANDFLGKFASLVGGSYEAEENRYKFIVTQNHNGTVIYDENDVRFKPKTAYTFTIHGNVARGGSVKGKPNIAIRYDDDTLEPIFILGSKVSTSYNGCFTSDKTKTIKQIEIYMQTTISSRIYAADFGIFEGEYTSPDECFAAYDGEQMTVMLDQPLRSLGTSYDELDIISGKVKRRICVLNGFSDLPIEINDDGYCILKLSDPIDARHEVISEQLPLYDFDNWIECDRGICISENPDEIFFRTDGDLTTPESVTEYLAQNTVRLTYVTLFPTEEKINIDFPYREKYTAVELEASVAPKLFYAEY